VRAVEKDRRQRDLGGGPAAADTGESVVVVPAVVVIVVPAVFVVSVVVVIVVVTPALIFPSVVVPAAVIAVVVVPAAVITVVIVVVGRGWRLRVWLRGRNGCGCRRRRRVRVGFGRRLGGPTVLAALASRLPRRPLVTVRLGPRTVPAARTVIARRCLGRFELLELDADGWAERLWAGPAGGGQQCTEDHPDQQGCKQDGNGEAAHRLPG